MSNLKFSLKQWAAEDIPTVKAQNNGRTEESNPFVGNVHV